MRREEKRKLSINRRIIVNHLNDLESLLDYLISKQIFTTAIRQKINKESQGKDRIRHMLDILESKNIVLAYQYFLEALVVTGHTHVANIVEPDYCSSEQCRLVIERERLRGFQYSSNNNNSELSFPVVCTQSHGSGSSGVMIESSSSPSCSSPSSSSSLSNNNVNPNTLAPMSLQRIIRQNPNYLFSNTNNNSNYFLSHNSKSSQSTSRSTSSSGCQSSSMSPTINRSRSSSVTAFLNSGRTNTNNNICTSSSVNGLVNLANKTNNEYSPLNIINNNNNQNTQSTVRMTISGMSYDDSDQIQSFNYSPSSSIQNQQQLQLQQSLMPPPTPTYNIDWSDVNNLELDFHVTKSFPNIRKQLSPNEVGAFISFEFFFNINWDVGSGHRKNRIQHRIIFKSCHF